MSTSEYDPSEDTRFSESRNGKPLSSPSISDYQSTSEPSRGRFTSKDQVKKRKAAGDAATRSQSRVKRLKPMYNGKYLQLFNTALYNLVEEYPKRLDGLQSSQIGISIWSAEEKNALFQSLARKGRLDLRSVAAAIGTKSELEICVYLDLLRKNKVRREWDTLDGRLTSDVSSIKAADEISVTCQAALEEAADALSLLQYQEEERTEREKHPQTWLLTPSIARWADQSMKAGAEREQEVLTLLPAAALFDLKEFLRLSKRFFMNSSNLDGNWRTYTERRKDPSVMHSAFQDFHTLTVSLTRRLISSALFLASSRIRAETADFGAPKPAIRRKDVLAALDILGMEHRSKRTWANMARKCNLHVFENVRYKQVWGKRYTYDEVEEYLLTYEHKRGRYRSRTRSPAVSEGMPSQAATDNDGSQSGHSDITADDSASFDAASTTSDGALSSSRDSESLNSLLAEDEASIQERQDSLQDAYLESLDQCASQAEERRLWEMLGEDPARKMNLASVEMPAKQALLSRTRGDFVDWRDWTDYAADWETLVGGRVLEESFLANRLVGRTRGEGAQESSLELATSSSDKSVRSQSAEDSGGGPSHE